jgi:pimeloyl-ACP methyl ester carboxylesterase
MNAAAGDAVYDALARDPIPDQDYPPAIVELAFTSQGAMLSGLLYQANGPGPHPTVLLLHGLPGNEKNLDLAQALRRAGFNVLFFHYRGAWGSEGEYRLTGLPVDVAAAAEYLRANAEAYRIDAGKLSLLGHSMGGFAALAAGSRDPGLACVGAMAPANLALTAESIREERPGGVQFMEYADSLFMLQGFDGAKARDELLSARPESLDTRRFGPGLSGKSVFMITGNQDRELPPAITFEPTVAAYLDVPELRLQSHIIPGDHSFSWSRIQLTRLVADWLLKDCR